LQEAFTTSKYKNIMKDVEYCFQAMACYKNTIPTIGDACLRKKYEYLRGLCVEVKQKVFSYWVQEFFDFLY